MKVSHAFSYTCGVMVSTSISDDKYASIDQDAANMGASHFDINEPQEGLSELIFVFNYDDIDDRDIGESFKKTVLGHQGDILKLLNKHKIELANH
jgi:hypothetical protein